MFTHVYQRGQDGQFYWVVTAPGNKQEWYQRQQPQYRSYVSSLPTGRCVF